ncbi:MAG: rhodanese-like domain-containing protein [Flavobacteriales bacterium]|nr:rhodanese-like domain-containing protein [Flavobacteriales bacterium]
MRTFLFALPLVLSACTTPSSEGTALPPAAFSARITDGAQLVDVRTAGEFANGHIAHAVNLDWTSGELEAQATTLDKARPVLLYCASGRRSAAANDHLRKSGFTDVVDLDGDISAWRSAGLPVEQ